MYVSLLVYQDTPPHRKQFILWMDVKQRIHSSAPRTICYLKHAIYYQPETTKQRKAPAQSLSGLPPTKGVV